MAKVMQPYVLDSGLLSCQLPYSVNRVRGTGLIPVDGRRKDPCTAQSGLAFDDGFCFWAEKHRSGTGLAVHKFKDVLAHLAPLQVHDLAGRHPVRRRRRMISALGAHAGHLATLASITWCKRWISSRERNRVIFRRWFRLMPRPGLTAMYPQRTA